MEDSVCRMELSDQCELLAKKYKDTELVEWFGDLAMYIPRWDVKPSQITQRLKEYEYRSKYKNDQ